jgi:drug/metabolite transporter (DMT)-like permease
MNKRPPAIQKLSLFGGFFIAFLCIIFGANAVAIKISLTGLGVFTAAGIRFSMATTAIFLWALVTGQPLKIKKDQVHQLLIISVLFAVQLSLFYFGLSKTLASRGTLLVNMQPFFVLFLAHVFIPNDRITKKKFFGILIGFSGVAFVFLEKKGLTTDFQIGDVIILIATLFWAVNAVYTKKILERFQPFQVVLYPTLFSLPFFFIEALLWDGQMILNLDTKVIVALLYQSLAAASFGFVAWNTMLRKYGAVSVHSFLFIMPIAGVFLGGLVLGEPITFNILVALLLIVSGISIVNLKTKKGIPILHPGRNI